MDSYHPLLGETALFEIKTKTITIGIGLISRYECTASDQQMKPLTPQHSLTGRGGEEGGGAPPILAGSEPHTVGHEVVLTPQETRLHPETRLVTLTTGNPWPLTD